MTNPFDLGDDEERWIAAFMSELAALAVPMTPRDPRPLWWKAELVRRWDAERRAQAPLDLMDRIELVAGLAAAVVLLVWAVPTVGRLIAGPLRALLG